MRRNRGEYMKNLKKLTILHSNDMHGDFLAEQIDERLVEVYKDIIKDTVK